MELKKTYLPLSVKRGIIETVKSNSLTEKDGLLIEDNISKTIALDLCLLQHYYEMDIENLDIDELYENQVINEARKTIPPTELHFLEENIYYSIEEEKHIHNSLSGVVNRQLTNLINKIPDEKQMSKLLNKLPKALEKISPDTLNVLKDISLGKIK